MIEARRRSPTGSTPAAEQGFEDFFADQYRSVVRALVLLTGDAAAAEDLAQEAFARVYERWERVRSMDSPSGYVYRTAMHAHRRQLRRLALLHRRSVPGSAARFAPCAT